ncbi:hypothetical protein VTJ04DRAFT_8300 [Mycothermus thermophilus]|uniref:uncharacterized protein n=1 Tax=Humicola insolens TaxID=85995 RepID=UPI003742F32B
MENQQWKMLPENPLRCLGTLADNYRPPFRVAKTGQQFGAPSRTLLLSSPPSNTDTGIYIASVIPSLSQPERHLFSEPKVPSTNRAP